MENIESLSPADFADLKLAHFLLENESLAVRLQSKLGRPIHQGMQRLPARWRNRITKSAENAMGKALDMAMKTMGEDEPRRPQNKLHRVLVGTSGAVGGAFGLAALAVELPVSTTIMLRSIAEIARSQGENLSTMDARLACLEVFALGGRSGEDDHAETGYYAVRAVLASQVGEVLRHLAEGTLGRTAASPVTRLISSLAARFGVANLARLLVLNAEFLIVKGDWDKPAELVKVAVEKARHAWWISPTSAIVCKAFIGALILHARLLKRKGNRAQAATIRSDATQILEGLHRGKGQLDLMKLMVKIELLDVPTDFTRRTASKLRRYNWIGPYLDAWLSEQNVHTTSRVKHSFH